MENEKWKVSDFSELVGCSQKTVYALIKRGELKTVNEVIRGRKMTFVIASNEQIEEFKKLYGKDMVNESNCKETVTEENYIEGEIVSTSDKTENILDKFIELQNTFNAQLMNVNEELVKYKSQVPLLSYKADREGMYINEINQLKKDNEGYKRKLTILLTFTITLITILFLYASYKYFIH